MRRWHGLNALAVLHLGPRHRPRLGPQHRRRAAAGAAGRDDLATRGRRSTRRWRARRATRCSTRGTASSFSFGYELPTLDGRGALLRHVARRLAVNGDLPGADRLPADRDRAGRRRADVADQPSRTSTCDPNAGGARTTEQWFDTELLPAADAGRQRRPDRRRRPQHRARPGLRAHRPVAVQELRPAAAAARSSCASRRSTCSIRIGWATPGSASARRPSARSPAPTTAGSCSSASSGAGGNQHDSGPHLRDPGACGAGRPSRC